MEKGGKKWTDKIGCYGGQPRREGWGMVCRLSSTVLTGNCENPVGGEFTPPVNKHILQEMSQLYDENNMGHNPAFPLLFSSILNLRLISVEMSVFSSAENGKK